MGRLFVIEREDPVYKCKQCQTDLGVPNAIVSRASLGIYGKVYEFRRVFNMFLVPSTVPLMSDVLCVYCSSFLGYYYRSAVEYVATTYGILRNKLHGPEGSDDEV